MTYVRILLGVILLASSAMAESTQITVTAGEAPAWEEPTSVTLPKSDLAAGMYHMQIDGSIKATAQVDKEGDSAVVRWIEPNLAAGQSKTYKLVFDPAQRPSFKFKDGDGFRELWHYETPVWRDMIKFDPADRANTFKPYKHVYGFRGEPFITKGPGGKYTHHRGIFFGFKAFDGKTPLGDYWHCPAEMQQHVKYLPDREFAGPLVARDAQVVDWVSKDGKPVVRDTREFTTWAISPTRTIIDCTITVETLTGAPVRLDADAHHAGYHFRAAQSVADAKDPQGKEGAATYIRPASATTKGNDVWADCPWIHCSFDIESHHYQVTHIDGPGNPKPTTYSTRPYGRFGAFFTTETTPDKPLKVSYRLILGEGDPPSGKDLEKAANSYTNPLTGRIEGAK